MKPKSSCDSCRHRHRKCITRPNATRCNGCEELGRACTLSPNFQFRPSNPFEPDGSGRANRSGGARRERRLDDADASSQSASGAQHDDGRLSHAATVVRSQESPASGLEAERSPETSEWVAKSPLRQQPSTHEPVALTQREAFLYRTWVQKIALIVDSVDDERHFAVAVSRLALEQEVLLNGILGVASRFDSLANDPLGAGSNMESAIYHGRCIELLIDLLDKPAQAYDATLLAAVVLSRLYEENDTETDSLTYHLAGTSTLLDHEVITRLAAEGGIAEAACWIHLRQAIYIAIIHRQPLNRPLRVYENLTAFRKVNDTSCANRVVYLFAKIILQYFPKQPVDVGLTPADENWSLLEMELDRWFKMKPVSLEPIYYQGPDTASGRPFPCIWMASSVAGKPTEELNVHAKCFDLHDRELNLTFTAVALQYYYSGLIVIKLHRCTNPFGTGFEATTSIKINERSVASYLCILMGLALSNEHALNAWYLPCHMLHLCGYVLRSRVERAHTIEYLETAKRQIQWKTSPLVTVLTQQWAELDGYETEGR